MALLRNSDIPSLVQELKEQNLKKYDIISPSQSIEMVGNRFNIAEIETPNDGFFESLQISTSGAESISLDPTKIFHAQIAEKMGIPKNYYDKMNSQSQKDIINYNVNYWLQRSNKNYMIRSFKDDNGGGVARAFLSDRFRTIDHWDILITALDEIKNHPNIEVEACDLSESKMYVRFFDPTVEIQAPELLKNYRNPETGTNNSGDSIISGFTLTNSEIGSGGYAISPRAIILACKNGMIQKKDQMRRVHLGEKKEAGSIRWSENTERQNLLLIQSQTRDAIRTFLSPEYWNKVISDITEKAVIKLEHPIECTKNVCKSLALTEQQTENVLNYFMDGGQRTRFGVSQALTYLAHETPDSDLQYDLEDKAMELIPVMGQYDKA